MVKKSITITKTTNGCTLTAESYSDVMALLQHTENVHAEIISDKKARSYQQLKYYWKSVLPTFVDNIDGLENYVTHETNGKFNYEPLHRYFTASWALEKGLTDLIQSVPIIVGKKIEYGAVVSINFGSCSQKLFNDYLEWLSTKFNQKTNGSLSEAIKQKETI